MLTCARAAEIVSEQLDQVDLSTLDGSSKDTIRSLCKQLSEIHLSTKSFDVAAAKTLSKLLLLCDEISVVDLSDIIAGRAESIALEVLFILCSSLTSERIALLDMSENALGEKGIRKLEMFFRELKSLEEVQFHNNGLSALSMQLLCEDHPENFANCYLPKDNLKRVSFHNNMSGDEGAVALASLLNSLSASTLLQEVRMSSCRVKAMGGLQLVESLANVQHSLVRLNLSDSMFGEDVAQRLAALFPFLDCLEDLNLKDTGLEASGVALIINALLKQKDIGSAGFKSLPNLKHLDLACLEIGAEEAEDVDLADEMEGTEEANEMVEEGVRKPLCYRLGKVLRLRSKLVSINLDENELETSGALRLIQGFLSISPLRNPSAPIMYKLRNLSLKLNQVSGKGGVALCKLVKAFGLLSVLELDDNCFSESAVKEMQDALSLLGKQGVLCVLDENDPEGDEDDDDFSGLEFIQIPDSVDELNQMMEKSLKVR